MSESPRLPDDILQRIRAILDRVRAESNTTLSNGDAKMIPDEGTRVQ
jgi:hypothetical protein